MSRVPKDIFCYRVKYLFQSCQKNFGYICFVSVFCSLSALECLCMPELHIDSYEILYTSLFGWQVAHIVVGF